MRSIGRKIPRGQLYFEPSEVYGALARGIPGALRRGDRVRELESRFAELTGSPRALALPRTRIAVHLILKALDLPEGSQVIMSPVTIPDIVNAVLLAGLRPVFVDLGQRTCNVDYDALAHAITDETSALLITHLCGFPSDMDRIMALARDHDLRVIEDCSQSIGGSWQGQAPGLTGDAGVYSLTTLKPVSSFYGCLMVSRDSELTKRVEKLSAHFPPPRARDLVGVVARDTLFYLVTHPTLFSWGTYYAARLLEKLAPVGTKEIQKGNLPLVRFQPSLRRDHWPGEMLVQYTDCQANMALPALERMPVETARRSWLASRLYEELRLRGVPGLPMLPDGASSVYWRCPLWTAERDALRAWLTDRFIDTATSGLLCASREDAFSDLATETPNAFQFIDEMLLLPIHPSMTEDDMCDIAEAVGAFYDRRR